MEDIALNGHSLNISRYVSTTQVEAEIDLAATHAMLARIEDGIREATTKHNGFLKELGLPRYPSPDPEFEENARA